MQGRFFVALNPDAEVRGRLVTLQAHLLNALQANSGLALRPSLPTQFHLTLLFLGTLSGQAAAACAQAAEAIARGHGALPALRFARFGSFPAFREPKVFWVGFAPQPALATLQQRLVTTCPVPLDCRDFSHPHVTLARVKPGAAPSVSDHHRWLSHLALPAGLDVVWKVRTLSLMRSTPRAGRSEYETLENFSLGND